MLLFAGVRTTTFARSMPFIALVQPCTNQIKSAIVSDIAIDGPVRDVPFQKTLCSHEH